MGTWKLNVHLTGEHDLYNLTADPGERHNAIRDPGSDVIVQSLYEGLIAWQRETNDPLVLPNPLG